MVSDIITVANKARYVIDQFEGCKFATKYKVYKCSLDFSTNYSNWGSRGL